MSVMARSLPAFASVPARKLWFWPLMGLCAVAAGVGAWLGYRRMPAKATLPPEATFYHVVPMDLPIRIQKEGELQAVNNIDVVCMVEGGTTLTELVKEGTFVHKGDLLVRMDASAIQQKVDDTHDLLQAANDDLTNAVELEKIQEDQNAANLQAAQVALDLALIDKEQYDKGTYPQAVGNAKSTVDLASLTLKDKQDDLDRLRNLFGRGFVTATDIKKAEIDLITAKAAVTTAQTALNVLQDYTHRMDLETKVSAVAQAQSSLERTKRQNSANLDQKRADREAKQEKVDSTKRTAEHLADQLAACTITAPSEGMVIYASSLDRNAQQPLQPGLQVHERQLLIRLPDNSSMKDVVRIPEALAPKVYVGQRAAVHVLNKVIGATLTSKSPIPDNANRFWNPDLKEYPVDLTLDSTPPNITPGATAPAEILLDRVPDALAVPLAAVYASGNDSYVFVKAGDEVKPVKAALGKSNETHVQLTSGVSAGQDVLLLGSGEGRELLEKNGIKVEDAGGIDDPWSQIKGSKRKGKPKTSAPPSTQPQG